MNYNEFAQKIKEQYPQYKDIDNKILAQKMVEKFPVYESKVEFNDTTPDIKGIVGEAVKTAVTPLIPAPLAGAPDTKITDLAENRYARQYALGTGMAGTGMQMNRTLNKLGVEIPPPQGFGEKLSRGAGYVTGITAGMPAIGSRAAIGLLPEGVGAMGQAAVGGAVGGALLGEDLSDQISNAAIGATVGAVSVPIINGAVKSFSWGSKKLKRVIDAFREADDIPIQPQKPVEGFDFPKEPVPLKGTKYDLPSPKTVPSKEQIKLVDYYEANLTNIYKDQQTAFGKAIEYELKTNPTVGLDVTQFADDIAAQIHYGKAAGGTGKIEPAIQSLINKVPRLSNEITIRVKSLQQGALPPTKVQLSAKEVSSLLSRINEITKKSNELTQPLRKIQSKLLVDVSNKFGRLDVARKEYARFMNYFDELSSVKNRQILEAASKSGFAKPTVQRAADQILPQPVKDAFDNYKIINDNVVKYNTKLKVLQKSGTPKEIIEYKNLVRNYEQERDTAKRTYDMLSSNYKETLKRQAENSKIKRRILYASIAALGASGASLGFTKIRGLSGMGD